jgi:transposase
VVDPQPGQTSKGRPTSDVPDGQWLQRRHTFGLLASAFRPTAQLCVRRRSLRQRAMLLTYAGQPLQHRHKALTQMQSTLQHVVSDSTGVTGWALLRALLAGARAPGQRAQLRDSRCQHDAATIARALAGNGREEPLGSLAPAVALSDG